MSKKNLIIAGAVIAVLLTAGITVYAKAVEANNNGNRQENRQQLIKEAVSEGIISQEDADKLQNYIHEKRQAQMKKKMEKRLTQAVQDGTITEDEAQEIQDWYDSRPEAMKKLGNMKMRKGRLKMKKGNCQNNTNE